MKFPLRNKITDKKIKQIDLDREYDIFEMYGRKPDGFWYACGSDWYEFKYEGHENEGNKYLYKINLHRNVKIYDLKIKDKNKILCINNIQSYDAFCDEYGIDASYFVKREKSNHLTFPKNMKFPSPSKEGKPLGINWPKVKEHYGGIEICPYLYEKRNDWWYFTWDVGSGVIWNLKPILKNVQLVGTFF